MYNPYQNNNQSNQDNQNNSVNQNYHQVNEGQSNYNNVNPNPNQYTAQNNMNGSNQLGNSYFPRPPVTPPITPPKKPKKKSGLGKRIAAIVSCCVLSSVITAGAFVGMLQSGLINVSGGSDGESAFVLNKVVENTSTESSSGEVEALSYVEIGEKVVPSVVCVQNYQVSKASGFWGTTSEELGLMSEGSGVIINEGGYIITNAHVVDGATNLKVILYDDTVLEAELVGQDNASDLAVIKVNYEGLIPAEFGSSSDLRMGDDAIVIGNPGGMTFSSSMTTGIISALDRQISTEDYGYALNVIQTNAEINPGNSGGPLLNIYGQVVGITTSKFVSEGYEGLGFALPIDDVLPIVNDLIDHGYVKDRAMLGISGQFFDSMTAGFYGLEPGMVVSSISSPNAIAAGLKQYDIITEIDGVPVTSQDTISSILITKSPGEEVDLTVYRESTGQKDLIITIELVEVIQ